MLTLNNGYIEELYFQYLRNPESVSQEWRLYFTENAEELQSLTNGVIPPPATAPIPPSVPVAPPPPIIPATPELPVAQKVSQPVPVVAPAPAEAPKNSGKPSVPLLTGDQLLPISGVAERIVNNMDASLRVPTATSVRTLPVKALEENRAIINQVLSNRGLKKVSFTHILAWAIVRSLAKYPQMNDAFATVDGKPHRIKRADINIGLAVDSTRKDGSRSLVVPSVKKAQTLTFSQFVKAYDALIVKARDNKLELDDLMGATCSLTNPGMIGTIASIPRLMEGQGLIIAAGSIDYPPEYRAVDPTIISSLAISKVLTITSTYDHRIIQGAESGEFLDYMEKLLIGNDRFYEQIFASLQIPFEPVRWARDYNPTPFVHIDQDEHLEKETKVVQLINAYRVRGHLYADINPLGFTAYNYPELEPSYYGFTLWDLDRSYDTGGLSTMHKGKLRDILALLRDTYCGKIGLEFMHIQDPEKKMWIRHKFETKYNSMKHNNETKARIFGKLVEAETFEKFIHTKFLGQKRFSLEGGEALIPMLDVVLDSAAEAGKTDAFIGMAHRGRLNVLVNILKKSTAYIFREFKGGLSSGEIEGSGDVKYHLGAKGTYTNKSGSQVSITLAPNPSHLEAVDPVVVGMARARQDELNDRMRDKVFSILIHGDSAFIGQGVVAETFNLSKVRAYNSGGTVHIIVNNQIGFTTAPDDARSTTYASDIAKLLSAPILHVNGGDPEAVLTAALFAMEYQATFKEDIVIDMYCYRKYGHNEADEPGYTQPLLYKKIRALKPFSEMYGEKLIAEKVLSKQETEAVFAAEQAKLNAAYDEMIAMGDATARTGTLVKTMPFQTLHTAVPAETLRLITEKITSLPAQFNLHPKLKDLLERRRKMVFENIGLDWGMGEALAFGSLVMEGYPVRLTGQDAMRGTFSHRHAVLVDYLNEREFTTLNHIREGQALCTVYDSTLSEYAVLGFEYGYSIQRPKGVTIWEAQFGDFVNGAQIVIDQFISSGESKWGQTSGLVMLLPHGYEGQGPEHSSARPERFLQLCAENNMIVCNLSNSAQYFHALRRQALREHKKPLILMMPKSLLRQQSATLEDFSSGKFNEIIDDATIANHSSVSRVLICSGKVYYDLVEKRQKLGASDVAIVRLEQLYPFHEEKMKEILQQYSSAKEIIWVQEEPKNMGYWFFVQPYLSELIGIQQRLRYVGRKAAASPATGYADIHAREQQDLLQAAFAAQV